MTVQYLEGRFKIEFLILGGHREKGQEGRNHKKELLHIGIIAFRTWNGGGKDDQKFQKLFHANCDCLRKDSDYWIDMSKFA